MTYRQTNPQYLAAAHESAENWAKANPSDPFAFRRAYSHMLGGYAIPSDYTAEWINEHRTVETAGRAINFTVKVPISMGHP